MSVIGPDLTVNGDLISKGELRIDSEVQGARVVIGEHAHITGSVVAEDVVILGHVMGSVRGLRVSLQSTSHVEGDVRHQALVMEQGAFFEGKSLAPMIRWLIRPHPNSARSMALAGREAIGRLSCSSFIGRRMIQDYLRHKSI